MEQEIIRYIAKSAGDICIPGGEKRMERKGVKSEETMAGVKDILDRVEEVSGTLLKQEILRKGCEKRPELVEVLHLAYDPYIRFGVREETGITSFHPPYLPLEGAVSTLKAIAKGIYGRGSEEARRQVRKVIAETGEGELVRRILKKDLRIGMGVKSINRVLKKIGAKLIPDFKVMLASTDLSKIEYPCWVEPKLDGVRCIAVCDEKGKVKLYSRSGKEFTNFPEIVEVIEKHSWPNIVFDGEVVVKKGSFQDLMTLVRATWRPPDIEVEYVIFDRMKREVFERQGKTPLLTQRRNFTFITQESPKEEALRNISGKTVESEEDLWEVYRDYRLEGYEGAVAKNLEARYEFKRSPHWVKLKPKETHDLEVIGSEEGTGKFVGKLGKFIVDFEGVKVGIGSGFSNEERRVFWKAREEMIGRVLEVEAQEVTRDGSLRHPRFVRLREDK